VDQDKEIGDTTKSNILLSEYSMVRTEIRVYSILEIIFICISVLTFAILFMLASISGQYILLFISPMVSILLLIIALAMNAYTSNLGLLASEIEDKLNEQLGENIVKWESTVGIFGGTSKDFMIKRLGRAWLTTSFFGIAVVSALIISTLWYGFGPFYSKVGYVAWIFLLFDITIIVGAIIIGYGLLTGTWKKVKKFKKVD
jgi:hypothetical protein